MPRDAASLDLPVPPRATAKPSAVVINPDSIRDQPSGVHWASSLRNQIGLALLTLALAFAGTVAFTLYEVELRKHDYTILNLAGQLRVISPAMMGQARHYLEAAGGAGPDAAGSRQFAMDLSLHVAAYEKIIKAFKERNLPVELTGEDKPLQCNWDQQSINQLNATARVWEEFRAGLLQTLGEGVDNAALRRVAGYVLDNEHALQSASHDLTKAFQRMMEGKLRVIKQANQAAMLLMALLLILVLVVLQRRVLRPVNETLAGFSRVAQGDLGYQVPVTTGNEIGQMTQRFNHLSHRLRALFQLSDRINRGTTLSDTLAFIHEEFRTFLPLDWVGIVATSPDQCGILLERHFTPAANGLREGEYFADDGDFLSTLLRESKPLSIADLAHATAAPATLVQRLAEAGLGSAVFLPLAGTTEGGMALVFAARGAGVYSASHLELLGNIAGQVTHSVDRTVVMEDLVVSAVAGLAKLAENRDPETGDHLVRMSLYSVVVAEELARDARYREALGPEQIRDIYRFAPMHDIGKVGIKDDILLKPGRLDPAERAEMERHPTIGGEVLRRCESQMNAHGHSVFTIGIEIAECHHEKFDGSGYPAGLRGEDIPLSARIVAVADVFDALTSRRPYKEAWPVDKALATLRQDAGKHFDPEMVAALERNLPRVMEIYERLKHV